MRIVVHGESIGGMVACHLARHLPVDALICDRTFATLDATAARLMVSTLVCLLCSFVCYFSVNR